MTPRTTLSVYPAELAAPARPANQSDVLIDELAAGWESGSRLTAREVWRRHPECAGGADLLLELAYEEYCQRRESGESLDPEAFCQLYPECLARLRQMLVVDLELGPRLDALLAEESPEQWPEPGETIAGFRLVEELGRGAFARVFLAEELNLSARRVVIKLSLQGRDEARTLARLQHPHIVPVLDLAFDATSGLAIIKMPYEGRVTLADFLMRLRLLPALPRDDRVLRNLAAAGGESRAAPSPPLAYADAAARLGTQMAQAIGCMHALGVCHGDLKPANVLLDFSGRAQLLDFNLAAYSAAARRSLGGTLPYMAPEQLAAVLAGPDGESAVDPRSDLYAWGAIMYESLTGHLPFDLDWTSLPGLDDIAALQARQLAGPRPLRELNPHVDPPLARLVEACLSFDPADRPQTAQHVLRRLEQRQSASSRVIRWAVRHGRTAALLAASVLLVAALGLGWSAGRPSYSQRQAEFAWDQLYDRKWESAEQAFSSLIEAQPQSALAWYGRARARAAQGEYALAITDYAEAEKIDPQARFAVGQGYCCQKSGAPVPAIEHYLRARQLGTLNAKALSNLGYAAYARNQPELSEEALTAAIASDPDLPNPYSLRVVWAINHAARLDTPVSPQAVADARRALELDPHSPRAHITAAHAHLNCQLPADSYREVVLDHLEQALKLGMPHKNLRGFVDRMGRDPRLMQLFSLETEANPDWMNGASFIDPLDEDFVVGL